MESAQITAVMAHQFSVTIASEPVQDGNAAEYSLSNLQAMFSTARLTARIKPEAIRTLDERVKSFLTDMIPAIRTYSFGEVFPLLQKYDPSNKDRYPELGIRIVRVRIDEALRLVGARLSAIGTAA